MTDKIISESKAVQLFLKTTIRTLKKALPGIRLSNVKKQQAKRDNFYGERTIERNRTTLVQQIEKNVGVNNPPRNVGISKEPEFVNQ